MAILNANYLIVNATEPVFRSHKQKNWLKSLLHEFNVSIEFIKKDGSIRTMICTLDGFKIPDEQRPKNVGKEENNDVCAVFDIEKQEWRSFRYDSIQKIEFSID